MDADADDDVDDDPMTEREYLAYLAHERHMYAWVLQRYASVSAQRATELAAEFYYYEPPTEEYRCLVFHESAWHWALKREVDECYWLTRPELKTESEEYDTESAAIDALSKDDIPSE